jgi:hypothetical protein
MSFYPMIFPLQCIPAIDPCAERYYLSPETGHMCEPRCSSWDQSAFDLTRTVHNSQRAPRKLIPNAQTRSELEMIPV